MDNPSLGRPHWLNALTVTVKWFTDSTPIDIFVMAITGGAQPDRMVLCSRLAASPLWSFGIGPGSPWLSITAGGSPIGINRNGAKDLFIAAMV
jgi:hypothetical protein